MSETWWRKEMIKIGGKLQELEALTGCSASCFACGKDVRLEDLDYFHEQAWAIDEGLA